MEKKYLTLQQNLSVARVFLNMFDLVLENKNNIWQFDVLKILDRYGNQCGRLYFDCGIVRIETETSLGLLIADYEIASFNILRDNYLGGGQVGWSHVINFNVKDSKSFGGTMRIPAIIDTHFSKKCCVNTAINYIDKDGKDVNLYVMSDGYQFGYIAKKGDFREKIEINIRDCINYSMYHTIVSGKEDILNFCFPDCNTHIVKYDFSSKKICLKTIVNIRKNSEKIKYEEVNHESVGEFESVESNIQKGLLMQEIDPDFSLKIKELINDFNKNGVSFLENLIDAAFNDYSKEEKKALFGTDIRKIKYQNGADNLDDAYFGKKDSKNYLPTDIFRRVLKR